MSVHGSAIDADFNHGRSRGHVLGTDCGYENPKVVEPGDTRSAIYHPRRTTHNSHLSWRKNDEAGRPKDKSRNLFRQIAERSLESKLLESEHVLRSQISRTGDGPEQTSPPRLKKRIGGIIIHANDGRTKKIPLGTSLRPAGVEQPQAAVAPPESIPKIEEPNARNTTEPSAPRSRVGLYTQNIRIRGKNGEKAFFELDLPIRSLSQTNTQVKKVEATIYADTSIRKPSTKGLMSSTIGKIQTRGEMAKEAQYLDIRIPSQLKPNDTGKPQDLDKHEKRRKEEFENDRNSRPKDQEAQIDHKTGASTSERQSVTGSVKMSRARPASKTTIPAPSERQQTPSGDSDSSRGQVLALSYSAGSGQYILTGSTDRSIRLYNPHTSALIQSYSAHGYEVLDLAVADANDRFISVGGDKTVFLWDVATAQTLRRWSGHAGRVNACAFGGEGDSVVLSGSFDSTVKIWDTKQRSERPIMTLAEAKDSISAIAVAGAEVMTGSVDGRVRCYDLRMGCLDQDVIGFPVTSLAVAKANDSYLVSTLDSTLRLMDKTNGKLLQAFRDQDFANATYRIRSTLAAADSLVISGTEDGAIYVWDLLSGSVKHKLRHTQQTLTDGKSKGTVATSTKKDVVSAVAWNQLRKEWASAGGDGSVVVWGLD
ncbi:hypothetical protein MBLNU459_g1498t1 [Dothideomycetes sp. NU459]